MEPIVFGKEWFEKYQSRLVRFANTKFGRYTLRIHGKRSDVGRNKITQISPNSITWKVKGKYKTEFRTHAKYSKRLYYAFKPLWWVFHAWDMMIANNLDNALNLGFDTLTTYPDSGSGSTTVDGQVYRVSSATSFSTIRSGAGTNVATTNTTSFNKQYVNLTNSTTGGYTQLIRSVFTFDTSSLTTNAVIATATASFYGEAKDDDYSMSAANSQLVLVTATPASNNNLATSDYNIGNFGSGEMAAPISYSSYNTSAYNAFTLNSLGKDNISRTSISRFGLRFGADVTNTSPGGTDVAGRAYFLRGQFADNTGTSQDPKLVVTYTSNFYDNYNDNSLNTLLWPVTETFNGATVNEQNNRLEIDLVSNSNASLYTGQFDFTNKSIHYEVLQVTNQTNEVTQTLVTGVDGTSQFWWEYINGSLIAKRSIATITTTTATLTYSSSTHRWWRIRSSSGTIYWDTSADGMAWTNRASYSFTPTTDYILQLFAYAPTSSNPSALIIDNFNMFGATVTLTGTSGTSFSPKVTYYPSVTLTGTSAVSVYGTLVTDQTATTKSYLYKVYDTDDNFLGLWNDVASDLTYSQEINSAGSSIVVELARTSDSRFIALDDLYTTQTPEAITTTDGNTFVVRAETINNIGPGTDVDVNYRVEVWVFYGSQDSLETTSGELILTDDSQEITLHIGAVNGLRKFNGYITQYVSRYGSTDSVLVSVASFGRELDHHVIKSGSNTTVTYNSTAPNDILTSALDIFNAQGGIVSYASNSVDSTGTTVTYTFRLNTFLEVIKKCLELAPFDWYWYVGLGDDTVYFRDRPTTPAHYFVLGKHIESLDLEYNIEEITNLVYFTGGETAGVPLFKTYTDATSIANYRQGLKRVTDHRVTVAASAQIIGEGEIDRNDTPRYRSSVTILSEAYDIETISLGQLIGFRNFGNYIDDVTLQVVGIDYEPDKVRIQLDSLLPRVNKRIEDITRNLIELDNRNVPSAPS